MTGRESTRAAALDRRRARVLGFEADLELARAAQVAKRAQRLEGRGGGKLFAIAVKDIKADVAKLKELEAAHRAAAKADEDLAMKRLANANALEQRARDLEHPA